MPSSVDERYLPNDIFVTHRDLFDTFDAHTGLYRSIARRICGNPHDAEDPSKTPVLICSPVNSPGAALTLYSGLPVLLPMPPLTTSGNNTVTPLLS